MNEDFELPKAVVTRIVKSDLPENVQVAKDAKLAIQHAARVFIHYLTAAANDYSQEANRSTISAMDVQLALADIEFSEFEPLALRALEEYKSDQAAKKMAKKKADEEADE